MDYRSNRTARAYADMIKVDYIKVLAQRPGAIALLKPVRDKLILDVGCGEGTIARMLAERGARVIGYDLSKEQIKLARQREKSTPYGIKYFVSTANRFSYHKKFDKAFAVMVLCYSKDKRMLQSFFDSTYSSLKKGGIFVVLDMNTETMIFNKSQFGRINRRLGPNRVSFEFVIPNTKRFRVTSSLFSQQEFESCARRAGFRLITKKKLIMPRTAIKVVGKKYWVEFNSSNQWMWMIFRK